MPDNIRRQAGELPKVEVTKEMIDAAVDAIYDACPELDPPGALTVSELLEIAISAALVRSPRP